MRRNIFQAIADPTRRTILVLIAAHAMTPTWQAVSKHIRETKKYYQLEISKMKEIDKWLKQFRKIWEDRFNQLDKVLLKLKGHHIN